MIDGHYIQRMQRYEAIRREAEQWHLARAVGYREDGALRSLAARFRGWLSQRPSRLIASSDDALIGRTGYGGEECS